MPDSDEIRQLAAKGRDQSGAGLNPGDPDYDTKMTATWGGPPVKWHTQAMDTWPQVFAAQGTTDKIALVTGGTGGIGFYVVKLLARMGATVILPGRPGFDAETNGTVEAVKRATPNAKIVIPSTPLDLRSNDSVRKFGAALRAEQPRIDILCLNAGRGGSVDDPREVADGNEAIMQVNVLGHFLLAHELLPLLQKSEGARVVSQSSGGRFQAKVPKVADLNGTDAANFNAFDQYALSKAGNVLFTRGMNARLEAAGIKNVSCAFSDPGLASTGVNQQHDLVKSFGAGALLKRGLYKDTADMHTKVGHHAADGALPMVFGCVCPPGPNGFERDAWLTTEGPCETMEKAALRGTPGEGRNLKTEPLLEANYSTAVVNNFWEQCVKFTGAPAKL